MNTLPFQYTRFHENSLVSTPANNSHLIPLSAMMMSLNKINNSSLNLYGGSVVERSGFFVTATSTNMAEEPVAITGCYSTHLLATSYGDVASHCQSNNNRPASTFRFAQDLPHVAPRSVISQSSQTETVVSHIDESIACCKMRKKMVKRSARFVKNLSSAIMKLSRAGIEIPNGMSPHTIYCRYTREKRKAEQQGHQFNQADFQHRINKEARERLPKVIKQYYSSAATAVNVFSALHSRSTQQVLLKIMHQSRQG